MESLLFLIRHGEVEARYHRVFGGTIDMELSPQGLEQVEALGLYLNRIRFDAVYASPMRRVRQTVAPIVRQAGTNPIVIDGLREVDFGSWTGLSWEEVQERFQVSAFQWLHQLETGAIPEAEPIADFRSRVGIALERILLESEGKSVGVVCHGGVIRMILAILLELPFQRTSAFDVEYASITRVRHRPNKIEIELLNFTPWRDLPS